MTESDNQNRTDFALWSRPTLERFARQAADENRELRADLRAALDAYRQAVITPQKSNETNLRLKAA